MKKWFAGVMAALMVLSLAACTPTTEKNKAKETTEETEEMVSHTTGGAEDKLPDPDVDPVAIVSIYHKGDGDSLVQSMDSLESEEMDAELLVNKLIEYGVLTEGTEILSFEVSGEEGSGDGILNLNQAQSGEGVSDNMFITELGNTFTENFELGSLEIQVQGDTLPGAEDLEYNINYYSVE